MNNTHNKSVAQHTNDSDSESTSTSRRNYLSAVGVTLMAGSLAGCTGGGDDEDGSNGSNGSNGENESGGDGEPQPDEDEVEGDTESAEDAVDDLDAGENLEEYDGLVITEHERIEGEYDSHIIEGIVENTRDEAVDYVEVRVRIFDEDGNQLENWIDNTTGLDAGATWKFSVEFYDDFAEYDVAVVDSPLA